MIELTEQQQREIAAGGWPPRVRNPKTQETFVLLRQDLFERLRGLLENNGDDAADVEAMYRRSMEVFGNEGWSAPEMDVYDSLDPRRAP